MGRGAHNIHVVNAACVNGMCVGLKVISDVFYLRTARVRRHRCHELMIDVSIIERRAAAHIHMSTHMSAVGPGRGWGVRILVIPAGALVHRRPCDVEAGRYACSRER
jgi:hypothetical protein